MNVLALLVGHSLSDLLDFQTSKKLNDIEINVVIILDNLAGLSDFL